jgi:uncharacterized membrane protein HdeD (DUF308 family)
MIPVGANVSRVEALKRNSGWVIALGILLVVIGVLAIGAPLITGVAIAILVGTLILIQGIGKIFYAFKARSWGEGILRFLGGALPIVCGALMVAHPLFGLSFLTLLLAVFFFTEGVLKIVLSRQLRTLNGWGWTLFDGIVALLLGVLILARWPLSGTWAVGTLVGINILVSGWSIVMLGSAVRKATRMEMEEASRTAC